MKQKFTIRETTVPFNPPYKPLYFHGFTTRKAGICFVFGPELAAEYDTLEAVAKILIKIRELSGRNDFSIEPKFSVSGQEVKPHHFRPLDFMTAWDRNSACRECGLASRFHGG